MLDNVQIVKVFLFCFLGPLLILTINSNTYALEYTTWHDNHNLWPVEDAGAACLPGLQPLLHRLHGGAAQPLLGRLLPPAVAVVTWAKKSL